jgi:hypothetical protein
MQKRKGPKRARGTVFIEFKNPLRYEQCEYAIFDQAREKFAQLRGQLRNGPIFSRLGHHMHKKLMAPFTPDERDEQNKPTSFEDRQQVAVRAFY